MIINGDNLEFKKASNNFFREYRAVWDNYTYQRELTRQEKLNPANIKKVIFNPPATIVIFKDGTKEIVKTNNEYFDPEKGLAMAMVSII